MALRVVLLAVILVVATGFAPASFFSGKHGVALRCQQQTNFVDADVDCNSEGEGGQWSSQPVKKESVQDLSSFKVGQTNFVDEDVVCNSEGGKWSSEVMSQAPPSFTKSTARTSAANFGEEEWASTFSLVVELFGMPATALSIVQLCDRIDNTKPRTRAISLLKIRRQMLLTKMLQHDRDKYLETVKFLGARIPREELPNLQDVPFFNYQGYSGMATNGVSISGELITDCALPNVTYSESPLDKVLLYIFRDLVRKEIQWRSDIPGIKGLLEEGRHYMLSPAGAIAENQHAFVRRTLGALLTPVLPPFYRIFMAGIVPSQERGDPEWLANGAKYVIDQINNVPAIADTTWAKNNLIPGKQIGPWFYAPLLTSVVTPPFLTFLVGPSRINRRKDGQVGGMVVEKCKFLQESGCKGLCLHQCKLPAQQFFQDTLGVPLSVVPDFATQSCQWSWGEVPLPPEQDPAFPKGCLSACPTREELRKAVAIGGTSAESAASNSLCNA